MADVRRAWPSVAVFFLALLPRIYTAIAWAREPVWDGHYYDIGARSIALGRGYVGAEGGAWCHYPVGYSALLGLAYRVFGTGSVVGPLVNATLGALTAALLVELARHDLGERRAALAGVLAAIYPGAIAYTPLHMTEPTAAFFLVVAACAAARMSGVARIAVCGLALGLGTLVRPQTLLVAPAVALFVAGPTRERVRAAALTTVLSLAVVLPWTARNCVVMDGCALVSTNGGWNLAIGAFPRATGRFETLRGSDGCTIVTGQVQQDRCWSARAVEWIRRDPARWLGLVPKKLGFTFDHESFPIGYLAEADPDSWPEPRRSAARAWLSNVHRALLSLAPLGFVARPSRRLPATLLALVGVALLVWVGAMSDTHPFWPLAIATCVLPWLRPGAPRRAPTLELASFVIATLVVVHAVFFGEDRYHLVATPFMCLLVAGALRPTEVKAPPMGSASEP